MTKQSYATATTRAPTTCECCGEHDSTQLLHRGESHWLAACDRCHELAQTPLGHTLGWVVRAGNDPATVPYFRRSDSTWRANGEPINAQAAVEFMQLVGQMKTGLDWAI